MSRWIRGLQKRPQLIRGFSMKGVAWKRLEIKQGDRFSSLKIVQEVEAMYWKKYRKRMFLCLCDCGEFVVVRLEYLNSGHTTSCGCQRAISAIHTKTTHGCSGRESRTNLYGVWSNMKARCSNSNQISYRNYGARGIEVCQEWLSFEPFQIWAYLMVTKKD